MAVEEDKAAASKLVAQSRLENSIPLDYHVVSGWLYSLCRGTSGLWSFSAKLQSQEGDTSEAWARLGSYVSVFEEETKATGLKERLRTITQRGETAFWLIWREGGTVL